MLATNVNVPPIGHGLLGERFDGPDSSSVGKNHISRSPEPLVYLFIKVVDASLLFDVGSDTKNHGFALLQLL